MVSGIDIDKLMADRQAFDAFVYTPVEEAVVEFKRRINAMPATTLETIPHFLGRGLQVICARQVATPRMDICNFLDAAARYGCNPIFLSYHADKYTTQNETKLHLGKLLFYGEKGRSGGVNIKKAHIIDYNKYDGKTISTVKTHWGQSLVEFHHELLFSKYPCAVGNVFDCSQWYQSIGENASAFYPFYMSLFIRHGILFENFALTGRESTFTRNVFLPALVEVAKSTGLKPLIVPLVPTDREDDKWWSSYHRETEAIVKAKMKAHQANVGSEM